MLIGSAVFVAIAVLAFLFLVRPSDLPQPEPVSPTVHLDQRKKQIYENLRDLQFEYRLGKLSDDDYQSSKQGLQRELAQVLAEIDRILTDLKVVPAVKPAAKVAAVKAVGKAAKSNAAEFQCPHCQASFPRPMKFCGECGQPMEGVSAV